MYYVYVLYSEKLKKHYTGYTSSLKNKVRHHNLGLNRWSKRGIPWELVYWETYTKKAAAIKREVYLKSGRGREFLGARLAKSVTARV